MPDWLTVLGWNGVISYRRVSQSHVCNELRESHCGIPQHWWRWRWLWWLWTVMTEHECWETMTMTATAEWRILGGERQSGDIVVTWRTVTMRDGEINGGLVAYVVCQWILSTGDIITRGLGHTLLLMVNLLGWCWNLRKWGSGSENGTENVDEVG